MVSFAPPAQGGCVADVKPYGWHQEGDKGAAKARFKASLFICIFFFPAGNRGLVAPGRAEQQGNLQQQLFSRQNCPASLGMQAQGG